MAGDGGRGERYGAMAAMGYVIPGVALTPALVTPALAPITPPEQAAAERGDPAAQIRLAQRYETGDGIAQDLPQAAAWYRRAAELGNPEAQTSLATLYYRGSGVAHDDVQALHWYQVAADQGWA